ncbi:hypothetical protein N7494_001454 [Penicillium frequentans]|uniref:Uncharacterized protein n=1 Tax=Penicillium frequentans TaxID=3151616 RepID=A0AAD6GJY1_9EURO|nr:hypothetical protein N7494_001454 [Penicillium glabrum]
MMMMIWKATEADITLEFKATCTGGSGTIQVRDISYIGPEIVCTSHCDSSVLRTSEELLKDGDSTSTHFDDIWDGDSFGVAVDNDAPGGGQCMYIASEFSYYELNQTIADAQVGQTYHASAMWRLKSSSADAESYPTCTFDIRVTNLDEELLLDLAHMSYTLTTNDSGWMSVNGAWNATVSSAIAKIYMNCDSEQSEYYPDVEIPDVHLRFQRVICIAPSSSAIASSTPLRTSTQSSSVVVSPVSSSSVITHSVSVPAASVSSRADRSASILSTHVSTSANDITLSEYGSHSATSTVFATQTSTITACPSKVPKCPATAKSTYLTTETIVVSTTVCPVTAAGRSHTTTALTADDGSYASTILTTRTVIVTNCPARSQTTYTSTQTVVVGTTVVFVGPLPAASSSTTTEASVARARSLVASGNEQIQRGTVQLSGHPQDVK